MAKDYTRADALETRLRKAGFKSACVSGQITGPDISMLLSLDDIEEIISLLGI
jgi:hypothetical protein